MATGAETFVRPAMAAMELTRGPFNPGQVARAVNNALRAVIGDALV